jgi:hypothetical protein
MTANKNVITTVVGVIGAVATATQPVLDMTQAASLDNKGIAQLFMAIAFAVIGFFTGRPQAEKP